MRTHLCHRKLHHALSEGSSWAGIAAVLGTTGAKLQDPWSMGFYLAAGVAGLLAVLLRDKGAD